MERFGIVGGAVWLLRRKFLPKDKPIKTPVLDVISRKSVGVRSEICVVTVRRPCSRTISP